MFSYCNAAHKLKKNEASNEVLMFLPFSSFLKGWCVKNKSKTVSSLSHFKARRKHSFEEKMEI